MKSELRQEIGQLREKLLAMISANEQAPDLEKLDREEFILDMEEHDRLQAEKEELIRQVSFPLPYLLSFPILLTLPSPSDIIHSAQVREEIELSNLAKMYLREQIKRECWDSMTAKGKVIKVRTCRLNHKVTAQHMSLWGSQLLFTDQVFVGWAGISGQPGGQQLPYEGAL